MKPYWRLPYWRKAQIDEQITQAIGYVAGGLAVIFLLLLALWWVVLAVESLL